MNASGGGDYRRKESLAHIQCRVAGPILVNLLLCPVREHMIDVRMTQGPIQRRVGSVAMKVVNPGNINAQPTADAAMDDVCKRPFFFSLLLFAATLSALPSLSLPTWKGSRGRPAARGQTNATPAGHLPEQSYAGRTWPAPSNAKTSMFSFPTSSGLCIRATVRSFGDVPASPALPALLLCRACCCQSTQLSEALLAWGPRARGVVVLCVVVLC